MGFQVRSYFLPLRAAAGGSTPVAYTRSSQIAPISPNTITELPDSSPNKNRNVAPSPPSKWNERLFPLQQDARSRSTSQEKQLPGGRRRRPPFKVNRDFLEGARAEIPKTLGGLSTHQGKTGVLFRFLRPPGKSRPKLRVCLPGDIPLSFQLP